MKFSNLIHINSEHDCEISGLTQDSRAIRPGFCFCAYSGTQVDGRDYIDSAINQGAVAIIAEATDKPGFYLNDQIPVYTLKNLQAQLSKLAGKFYGDPSANKIITAVTGTSGKTSVSYFIQQLSQQPCGLIGTLNNHLTTPDAISLQQIISKLPDHISMEASSHALDQHRISAINIHTAIFTNLSHEHLDYHGSMEAYLKAKQKLFVHPNLNTAIINIADPAGRVIKNKLSNVITYGTSTADIFWDNIQCSLEKTTVDLHTPWGSAQLIIPLIGEFQLANIVCALAALVNQGQDFKNTIERCKNIKPVPGRMQKIKNIIIDYAHKPGALETVLATLKPLIKGKLICVFGAGGDRDKSKRILMGQVADKYCDQIILTNDNPRFEDPNEIIKTIQKGIKSSPIIELDRKQAIKIAINQSNQQDIIVIAGKGHENYQIIGDQRLGFSDLTCVDSLL